MAFLFNELTVYYFLPLVQYIFRTKHTQIVLKIQYLIANVDPEFRRGVEKYENDLPCDIIRMKSSNQREIQVSQKCF